MIIHHFCAAARADVAARCAQEMRNMIIMRCFRAMLPGATLMRDMLRR